MRHPREGRMDVDRIRPTGKALDNRPGAPAETRASLHIRVPRREFWPVAGHDIATAIEPFNTGAKRRSFSSGGLTAGNVLRTHLL